MTRPAGRLAGFSIIEFMIAITLSLLVLAALTGAFVANSRSRTEIERANEQMENGRFALQILTDDMEIAGYLSHLNAKNAVPGLPVPASMPTPCATTIASLTSAVLLHIQGYDDLDAALEDDGLSESADLDECLSDHVDGTDVVVVRRAATCVAGTTDCAWVPNAPYLQASLCADELDPLANPAPLNNWFQLLLYTGTTSGPAAGAQPAGGFSRTQRGCAGVPAEARQYLTHIYFVAQNDQAGDGIPTLKRAELGAGPAFTIVPLAHGIENLQVEYGVDSDGDGAPNTFTSAPATVAEWVNVMGVRLHVLARNTAISRDHTDTKTYTLAGANFGPFNDGYKRHVYQTSVRLNNPAGRRVQ